MLLRLKRPQMARLAYNRCQDCIVNASVTFTSTFVCDIRMRCLLGTDKWTGSKKRGSYRSTDERSKLPTTDTEPHRNNRCIHGRAHKYHRYCVQMCEDVIVFGLHGGWSYGIANQHCACGEMKLLQHKMKLRGGTTPFAKSRMEGAGTADDPG